MATITRILCPVDFSEASQHAFEHALAIARWYKASVSALHVYSHSVVSGHDMPPSEARVSDVELTRVRAETAAWIETASPLGVGVDVIFETGQPARHIIDLAASLPADVIVMGTHGASGFEHLVLGSVTEKVLRKASCPVLTVPPRAHATSTLPFKQLLCAIDFSESSLAALELALSLARESGSGLTLLHVIEWPWEEPPPPVLQELPPDQATALAEFRRYMTKSATERLKGLVPEAVRDRCRVVPRIAHGKIYVELLRVAAEERADLIVMGVHGRSAVDLLVFGSTTNQVIRRATCPVLTLRHEQAPVGVEWRQAMTAKEPDTRAMEDPGGRLGQALIEEFFRARDIDPAALHALPEAEAKRVLTEASVYASTKPRGQAGLSVLPCGRVECSREKRSRVTTAEDLSSPAFPDAALVSLQSPDPSRLAGPQGGSSAAVAPRLTRAPDTAASHAPRGPC